MYLSGFLGVINQRKTSCLQIAGEDAFGLPSLAIQVGYKAEFSIKIKRKFFFRELLYIASSIYETLFHKRKKKERKAPDGKRTSVITFEI